jgi:glyoxylase-like metal-dependent hydrolase (beta-lactamase superfamily II)
MFWLAVFFPDAPPVEVDHFVSEDGNELLPGDLRAIDTPGHTPGHTSYLLDRDGGVLLVGDAAVATKDGRVKRVSFNRSTPVVDGSLRHLAEFEFEVAAFGHSEPIRSQASAAFCRFAESLTSPRRPDRP